MDYTEIMINFSLSNESPDKLNVEVLVVNLFEDAKNLPEHLKVLEEALDESFKAKLNETLSIHTFGKISAKKVLLIGSGKKADFDSDKLIKTVGAASRALNKQGAQKIGLMITTPEPKIEELALISEGVVTAVYDPALYVTKKEKSKEITEVVILSDKVEDQRAAQDQVALGKSIAESVNWARGLVAEPANVLTPSKVLEEAQALAKEFGFKIDVLDEKQAKEKGMGAFCSIAAGSDEPSYMIALTYTPKTNSKNVFGMIGKGITFDSGGISIKPSEKMEEMKMDMAGCASVLGAMRIVGLTQPNVKVVAVTPVTENLPSGKSVRPGDVVKAMNDKTIEVINTDAEGRVVLSDALLWAQELGATHMVDLATLTGAVISALGYEVTGAMGNNDDWTHKLVKAAEANGEKMWQLPTFDLYKELLKSSIADYANVPGSRQAGSIAGAMFLSEFVKPEIPWVHLDIAGTAWLNGEKPYMAKGPTGVGIKTLVSLAKELEK